MRPWGAEHPLCSERGSGYQADLRGFFFNVADANDPLNSLLPYLVVTGDDVNGSVVVDTDNDGTPEVDEAAPPPPEAQIDPLAFYAGIELGTSGTSPDDIGSTSFIISATDRDVTADLREGQQIGIRAQSVGEDRESSSKLTGTVPEIPETGSISGTKYADLDESGNISAGDDGIEGWGISLYEDADDDGVADPGELVASATTDANGDYSFDGLDPGSYIVVEEDRAGWTHVTASELPVELAEGQDSTGNDFLNRQEQGEEETPSFEFNKDIDIAVSTDIDFDTDTDFNKEFDADISVASDTDVDGNLSTLTLDAEAVGTDTLVEADASVLTVEDQLSSVTLSVISAAA